MQGKLDPPRIRSGLVVRASLLTRLDEGLRGRLTLISAAAGYGKSTVIAQWLEESSIRPSAWISLDPLDGDLERFTRYVVAALRKVRSDCLTRTEGLLSAESLPSPAYLAETMAAEIEGIGDRVVLVLDDYHVIRDEAVHELLRSLVPKLGETLHLVLLGRMDPPLPTSLWLSRRWAHQLRSADLRFTIEETRAFFEGVESVCLNDLAVETIHRKTEGWIAGLLLAKLSMAGDEKAEDRVRAFSGTDQLVVDYLTEQALAAQPPEVREFLALTAPLGRFSDTLCDHLLADRPSRPNTRELLQHLYRSNLFLFPLDRSGGWYRYHHLFRQLLLDRFDELGPPLSHGEICRRAGQWFAHGGWLEEGIQLLLAAGDVDEAADVVARNLHEAIRGDLSRRTLTRWLALFPAGAERARLPLIIALLYIKIRGFDFLGAQDLLEVTESSCREATSELGRKWWREMRSDLEPMRAHVEFFLGRPEAARQHALEGIGSAEPGGYPHSVAAMVLAGGMALTASRAEALQFMEEGVRRAGTRGDVQLWPYLVGKTVSHLYWGELETCGQAALSLLEDQRGPSIPTYFHGHGNLFLGMVAYERDDLDEAERCFRAVEALRFETNYSVYHEALLDLAQVALARGDFEHAEHYAAEARACVKEAGGSFLRQIQTSFDWRHDAAAGLRPSVPSRPPTTPDFTYVSLYTPSWNWAWTRLREPDAEAYAAVLAFIDEAIGAAEAHGVARRVIQLQVLRTIALDGLARHDEAMATLEDACRRAEPLGFVRSFLDGGEVVQRVMRAVGERSAADTYAASILRAFDTFEEPAVEHAIPSARGKDSAVSRNGGRRNGGAVGLDEELTNRELDVLALLEKRLTNKEIAERLGISAVTVKSHTLRIYRKLGVNGRRAAVVEARALGILHGTRD